MYLTPLDRKHPGQNVSPERRRKVSQLKAAFGTVTTPGSKERKNSHLD